MFETIMNLLQLKGVKKSINSPEQQSCLNFLTTVLKCSAALRHATSNQNFVFTIYKKLIGFENHLLWEHVCAAASEKEFQNIMKDVSKNVHVGVCFLGELIFLNVIFSWGFVQRIRGIVSNQSRWIWHRWFSKFRRGARNSGRISISMCGNYFCTNRRERSRNVATVI